MLLPPDPPFEQLHQRDYLVKAFRKSDNELLLRGAIRDQRPGHLMLEGDTEPLTIHHMVVDLVVTTPSMEITEVDVVFETHPHPACPRISERYGELVGVSIARGFTHNVRSLFGGPRGCTHTTALLQAMAPVAVQCALSGPPTPAASQAVTLRSGAMSDEERLGRFRLMVNTCHVWDEGGELVDRIRRGEGHPVPLPIEERRQSRQGGPSDASAEPSPA